jgi:hypothetical protein
LSNNPEPYLVTPNTTAGSTQDLLAFLDLVERTPGISVMQITGTRSQPVRVKISATSANIQTLQSRFGHRLIIEPDRPLELY